jgi:hypothetical protein
LDQCLHRPERERGASEGCEASQDLGADLNVASPPQLTDSGCENQQDEKRAREPLCRIAHVPPLRQYHCDAPAAIGLINHRVGLGLESILK